MSAVERERRICSETDRPGESFTIARPLAGVELMSVRSSHRHWREAHASFTLALIHRTQDRVVAEWRTRGRALCSERGDIMAMEPGDTHVTERLKLERGAADFDIVRFSPALVADAARELGAPLAFHFGTPAVRDSQTFDALCGLVRRAAEARDPLELECASAHALRLLVSRLAERGAGSAQAHDPVRDYRVRKVRDYLRAHLLRRPALAELAVVADLSQYRLCFVFKRAYGISIGEYWNALRLAEAVRRLQLGTPVRMIVAELGYTDEPYFWRVFKAHYGMPPGGWLSLLRANDRRKGVLPAQLAAREFGGSVP